MDWNELILSIIRTIVMLVVARILLWAFGYEITKKLAYGFRCTICDFKASSSNLEVLTMMKLSHTHRIVELTDEIQGRHEGDERTS